MMVRLSWPVWLAADQQAATNAQRDDALPSSRAGRVVSLASQLLLPICYGCGDQAGVNELLCGVGTCCIAVCCSPVMVTIPSAL